MNDHERSADERPDQGRPGPEQLSLVRERIRRSRPPQPTAVAARLPVARVLVDTPLAHLDRPFDYTVRADQDDACVPGCRVKVRFAGREVDGLVLDRVERSDHRGGLAPLRRVVSDQVVLTPEVARLCREVADRYAGTISDVLRLAVPPRHARVERELHGSRRPTAAPEAADDTGLDTGLDNGSQAESGASGWRSVPGGEAFLARLADGGSPRGVWSVCPGESWEQALVEVARATLRSGRGVVICVPDARDVTRVRERVDAAGLADRAATLTADLGPAPRYRAFLRVLRGAADLVVGTRAAAFAPVRRLGLAVVWDDGDDLHAEQRAPYPHTREVLTLRAYLEQAGFLLGGHARTAEGAMLVQSGWAESLEPAREAVRAGAPLLHVTGDSDEDEARDPAARTARLPHRAFRVAREALRTGPVLVQVPRGGYLPALSCVQCRQPARCRHCHGPLALRGRHESAACRWCGRVARGWRCQSCGDDRFRAPVVGSERTAEELGRAFPSVPVLSSVGGRVRDAVADKPALVVATPGAEPVAAEGYAAALLLDTWLTLARPGLRSAEEAVRRWLGAAALVRPAADGGRVVAVGEPGAATLQALVRWDPVGFAERELADRASAHLPPAARLAVVRGPGADVAGLAETMELPHGAELLGPLPVEEGAAQLVVRVPAGRGAELSAALRHMQAVRSARKLPHLRVQIDPVELP